MVNGPARAIIDKSTIRGGSASKSLNGDRFFTYEGSEMMQRTLSAPEIGLIAGTRVALGVGIGLLMSGRLSRDQCKAAGVALTLLGALTTVPLALQVINSGRTAEKRVLPAA
jgi:hypothetical protein